MDTFDRLNERKRKLWHDKWDPSHLYPQFREYYGTGQRVRVTGPIWGTRTGIVGVTTGWRPCFLLRHRVSDHGSSDLLSPTDRIVAVQVGKRYVPVGSWEIVPVSDPRWADQAVDRGSK